MSSSNSVWFETSLENKYAIAIHNFHNMKAECLAFDVGDSLHLIYETKEWFYGNCARNNFRKGIIPKSYVKVKDAINVQGCFYPKESPLVREITSVLKEWGCLWKDLYLKSIGTENKSDVEKLRKTMLELMDFRRIILSSKLTVDEMKDNQQKVTQKIDIGNARLKLDLVVRDDQGNVIDPLRTSTINLFKLFFSWISNTLKKCYIQYDKRFKG
ncbi:hypothetical protein HELRODRAFT_168167 [Helobdella robusta]|uniref:SH3 domain-containing protein n=1 Tax=Helobdella robusta TaxID=6412 RepID=T1F095_HELRO|nr:hypothetical protein HELRODRAFT_168167 [Helobdella robusta]ESO09208.1 hypothetical protein HELRODRAFT_168167 [Helobdella robusta]